MDIGSLKFIPTIVYYDNADFKRVSHNIKVEEVHVL